MNITISGYGKMGEKIAKIAQKRGHNILNISNSKNPLISLDLSNSDVVIDFSTPNTAYENIVYAIERDIPVISGTTNWNDGIKKINKLCKKKNGSFLHSANFSLGMNIFFKINQQIAEILKKTNYISSIYEAHHIDKKDSPSGTALVLQNHIEEILNQKIEITSERIKNNIGIHKIKYDSEIDTIEIIHEAKKRDGFALGAIIAAEWLIDKEGVFTMKDVLND